MMAFLGKFRPPLMSDIIITLEIEAFFPMRWLFATEQE